MAESGCVRLTDVLSQDDAYDNEKGNYHTIQMWSCSFDSFKLDSLIAVSNSLFIAKYYAERNLSILPDGFFKIFPYRQHHFGGQHLSPSQWREPTTAK